MLLTSGLEVISRKQATKLGQYIEIDMEHTKKYSSNIQNQGFLLMLTSSNEASTIVALLSQ